MLSTLIKHYREALEKGAILIPTAEPEFTSPCACRIPPLPALSPLVKGGEGWGEGGFEACAFVDFGSAVGITLTGTRVRVRY